MTGALLTEKCCSEACCLPDGTCVDLPSNECLALDGTPQGCGTSCEDINCVDLQACCFENGDCEDFTPADCLAAGGIPQGAGTSCDDGLCELAPCPENQTCLSFPDMFSADISGFIISCLDHGGFTVSFDCVVPVERHFLPQLPCVWIMPESQDCGELDETCQARVRINTVQCFGDEWQINILMTCALQIPPFDVHGCVFNLSRPVVGNQSPAGLYSVFSHACGTCAGSEVTFGTIRIF